MNKKKYLEYCFIFAIYLLIWQLLSQLSDTWLFPGPLETVKAMFCLLGSKLMYDACMASILRIMAGFLFAFILACLFVLISFNNRLIRKFLAPYMLLSRSVPVAALSILVIIWFGSRWLAQAVVILVSVPIIYTQLLTALLSTDEKIIVMSRIYNITGFRRFRFIYLPQINKVFISSVRLTVGMSFKAGIAAELIGIAGNSIGERLYMTKLYFETGELFAWIIIIMFLTYVMEKITCYIFGFIIKCMKMCPDIIRNEIKSSESEFKIKNLNAEFNGVEVFRNINIDINKKGLYSITGKSGQGKTTLLNCISGSSIGKCSYAYQETRLLGDYSAVENLVISGVGDKSFCKEILTKILDESLLNKPVKFLSGGEKKRVELARALGTRATIVLLDEPFSGLDEGNTDLCSELIQSYANDKIILVALHEREEAARLKCKKLLEL